MTKCIQTLSLCSLILMASSCSTTEPRAPRDFKVSVTQDGKKIRDLSQRLIHRVTLSSVQAEHLFGITPDRMNLPFALKPKADSKQGIRGFEVVNLYRASRSGTERLGLSNGDIITAVGARPMRRERDFWKLLLLLKQKNTASITIERGSTPHKVLYFLADT